MTVPLASLIDLVAARARDQADLGLYRFLAPGHDAPEILTCAALARRARRIATALRPILAPGERALLLYPPGLDYILAFFGCLEAQVIAVPAHPPERAQEARALPRLAAILADCRPGAVLTLAAGLKHQASLAQALAPPPERWIATDLLETAARQTPDGPIEPDRAFDPAGFAPTATAYLQYTSGSTGTPKGVRISHANLLHNSALIQARFGHDTKSRGVIWLPPYHDMGLIGGIVQPLYAGFPVTLMSHLDFLKHPLKWLRAISGTRATTSGGPNFAYEMLLRLPIAATDFSALDLGCWEVAFTGAEPVRAATLDAFARRFAPAGFHRKAFYPCYGLAEHTLFVTGGCKGEGPASLPATRLAAESDPPPPIVGSGQAPAGVELVIVDPTRRVVRAEGETGEIWVKSASAAQGYWGRAEESLATFGARLAGTGKGPYLRTGDLGFCQDNELFVTGRLKDLIIVRGANHYPPDLEQTIENLYPDLIRPGGCAVFAIETGAEPEIVALGEVRARHVKAAAAGTTGAAEILAAIRHAINTRHGLSLAAVALLRPASLPKTTSGKVQRQACRSLFLARRLPVVSEWRAGG